MQAGVFEDIDEFFFEIDLNKKPPIRARICSIKSRVCVVYLSRLCDCTRGLCSSCVRHSRFAF